MTNSGSEQNALETVQFTSDGGFVVGGFLDSDFATRSLVFKSGGYVDSGSPFIGKISAADAEGSSAPEDFAWTWSGEENKGTVRSVKVDSSDNVYGVFGGENTLVKLDSSGTEEWNTGFGLSNNAQLNDLVLTDDGVILVGH